MACACVSVTHARDRLAVTEKSFSEAIGKTGMAPRRIDKGPQFTTRKNGFKTGTQSDLRQPDPNPWTMPSNLASPVQFKFNAVSNLLGLHGKDIDTTA